MAIEAASSQRLRLCLLDAMKRKRNERTELSTLLELYLVQITQEPNKWKNRYNWCSNLLSWLETFRRIDSVWCFVRDPRRGILISLFWTSSGNHIIPQVANRLFRRRWNISHIIEVIQSICDMRHYRETGIVRNTGDHLFILHTLSHPADDRVCRMCRPLPVIRTLESGNNSYWNNNISANLHLKRGQ